MTRAGRDQGAAVVDFVLITVPLLFLMLAVRSEEHTSELQSPCNLVCRLLLEKKTADNERLMRGAAAAGFRGGGGGGWVDNTGCSDDATNSSLLSGMMEGKRED